MAIPDHRFLFTRLTQGRFSRPTAWVPLRKMPRTKPDDFMHVITVVCCPHTQVNTYDRPTYRRERALVPNHGFVSSGLPRLASASDPEIVVKSLPLVAWLRNRISFRGGYRRTTTKISTAHHTRSKHALSDSSCVRWMRRVGL